ncbi:MAG TPA: DUF2007 domain-containing protein [bacterium]|nr:DUF2007 domain-containing protein [bacterium]
MNNNEPVTVYSAWGPAEAQVIKSLLESAGIKSILTGLAASSVHAFTVDGLGQVKVQVSKEDYEDAKKIIMESEVTDDVNDDYES